METAIRAFLGDPVFGVPILLLLIVVVAHVAVFLRSVANGPTPIVPSLRVMAADVSIVLLVALMFVMTKAIDLFTPADGATLAGIDLGPLYSMIGPLVFGTAGVGMALWLLKRKVEMIITSVQPPAPAPVSTVVVQSETPQSVTGPDAGTG